MSRFAQPHNPLFKSFSGDLTIVLRLLYRFKEEWDKTLPDWHQCLSEANVKGIFHIQHRWLSGLRTLGYDSMAQRISALQVELQENPSDLTKIHALKEGLEEIQADLTTEITALQGLMQHPKK